jgi:hypothetical protein
MLDRLGGRGRRICSRGSRGDLAARESLGLFAMVAESAVSEEGNELYIDILAAIIDVPGECGQLLYNNHVHSFISL